MNMKEYRLTELGGFVFTDAVKNTAEVLNDALGTNYTVRDWEIIKRFAEKFELLYDSKGNLIRK